MKLRSAFSLIELMVVMAIIAIVAAFVVPVAGNVSRGVKLSHATQTVGDEFATARQSAIGRNRMIEVRIYQYSDPEIPGSASCFRAVQMFEIINARSFSPLDKVQALPTATIIDSGAALSSLLDPAKVTIAKGVDALPRVGTNYNYVAFRFRPDGSTNLLPTAGTWFLTIHEETYGDGLALPPPNFDTLEVDPVNGSVRLFRPGV